MSGLALATLDDVEALSKPVLGDDRPRVARLIEMVSAAVVAYTGRRFEAGSETVSMRPSDGVLRLPQLPVTAVDEVTQNALILDPSLYTWDADGYVRPSDANPAVFEWVTTTTPLWAPAPMTVTYGYGYTVGDYPADVALVVAETVARRWAYGGVEDVQSESIDGYTVRYGRGAGTLAGGWSPEHRSILDHYRRSGIASIRLT